MARPMPRRGSHEPSDFNPEVSRGLLAILLLIAAILSLLSFFSLAGVAGNFIDSLLALLFGQVRYVFPIVLLVITALIVKDIAYRYRTTHVLGGILFILGFNGIVHLQKPVEEMVSLATQGYGGGVAGLALAWPLGMYAGYWGATAILLGVILIGVILVFDTSLAQIIEINKRFFMMLGWVGRQLVALVGAIPKRTAKVAAADDFAESRESTDDEEEPEEELEEEAPAFQHRTIVKKQEAMADAEEVEAPHMPVAKLKPTTYRLPNIDLLHNIKSKPTSGDIKSGSEVIKQTFQNFGIQVDMGEIRVGPTVTQYSMKPQAGVKLIRITSLANDLALAMAAHPIRIEAPIPGKSLVGIEVPNQKVAMVTLRELLESDQFKHREHNMMIAVGKDVAGVVHIADLPKMPHLLVAGATGSGKTVCINTIILSLLYQNTPETLRFIMVDPKRVELTLYNGIPHLLTPVITDAAKTVNALKWTIGEMERRFDVLASAGKRDILSYNKTASEKIPYIVFVIDELADLMATAGAEVEAGIIRIAQMARAVGIHLVVATQRPSVEVITGLMKANIPARIAFSVASVVDSRTILDCPGADRLLGRGDMLYLTADLSKPKRLQGAFVSEEEMKEIVNYLKGDEPPVYDESIVSKGGASGTMNMFGGPSDDQDPMFEEAKRIVIESGKASASLMQRRMKVGYARAARLLDELEEAGIVGPADGAKPREVFTEHVIQSLPGIQRPAPAPEMEEEEITMDAGGVVLDDPEATLEDVVAEESKDEEFG